MSKRLTTCAGAKHRSTWADPLLVSLFVAASLCGGVAALAIDYRDPPSLAYRSSGGILLLLAASVYFLLLRHMLRGSWAALTTRPAAWLISGGGLVCYLAALVLGPHDGIGWLFSGLISLWCVVVFCLLQFGIDRFPHVERLRQGRWSRTSGRAMLCAVILLIGVETVLRSYATITGRQAAAKLVVESIKPAPGSKVYGQTTNSLGFVGKEFLPERSTSVFRIAVLGDELTLAADATADYLSRVEGGMPGVEVYHFGLPNAGPREYLTICVDEVTRYQPNLVLCFVSAGNDITNQMPTPGWFDWRGMQICQTAGRLFSARIPPAIDVPEKQSVRASEAAYLRESGLRMGICRAPMSADMRRHWQHSLECFKSLADHCQHCGVPLGMVVIPGEFQVNAKLRATLQRRMGYEPGTLDVELPQRQIAWFAQQNGVPLLDLLPHLQTTPRPVFRRHDEMLNEHGIAFVVDALGRWLQRSYGQQIAAITSRSEYIASESTHTVLR